MKFGFSTGSIAQGDFERGLKIASTGETKAIELSALRESELSPLLKWIDGLGDRLASFEHISFHAPSRRVDLTELQFVSKLKPIADRGWAIIVHPDVIEDFSCWKSLGRAVCIENMDKRKRIGRTAAHLEWIFERLPDATFCFDIGHAKQVDPSMQEAEKFLRFFSDRLRQVHMSYVNSSCRHERLNRESMLAFSRLSHWFADSTAVILETPVSESEVAEEIEKATQIFRNRLVDGFFELPMNDEYGVDEPSAPRLDISLPDNAQQKIVERL